MPNKTLQQEVEELKGNFTYNSEQITSNDSNSTTTALASLGQGAYYAQHYGESAHREQHYGSFANAPQHYGESARREVYYGRWATGPVTIHFSENKAPNKIEFKQNSKDNQKMYLYVNGIAVKWLGDI